MTDDTHHSLYKRRLEAQQRAADEAKGFSGDQVDDLLELEAFLQKIKKIDLGKLAEEKLNKLTEKQRAVHELQIGGVVDRRLKEKRTAKGQTGKRKLHWKTREKKRRDYYKKVVVPRNRERRAQTLDERGWYPLLLSQWNSKHYEVQLTEEEWNEHIQPALGEGTPTITRYDASGPMSLSNLCVKAKGRVIFDGKEHAMRLLGYIV